MSFNSPLKLCNNIKEFKMNLRFSKFFIPYIELKEFVFDLQYDNKIYRFNYPQSGPFILESYNILKKGSNLSNNFISFRRKIF